MNLADSIDSNYRQKNINNFMVIAARGYLPLLQLKQSEIPDVIITVSVDGRNALGYASSNPNNFNVINYLIANGASIYASSLNNIKKYSETLDDIDLRRKYRQLYDRLNPEGQSYFSGFHLKKSVVKRRKRRWLF